MWVRTGPATAAALAAAGRPAATVGRVVHLARRPDTSPRGAALVAHELAHVVASGPPGAARPGEAGPDPLAAAWRAPAGQPPKRTGTAGLGAGAHLVRQESRGPAHLPATSVRFFHDDVHDAEEHRARQVGTLVQHMMATDAAVMPSAATAPARRVSGSARPGERLGRLVLDDLRRELTGTGSALTPPSGPSARRDPAARPGPVTSGLLGAGAGAQGLLASVARARSRTDGDGGPAAGLRQLAGRSTSGPAPSAGEGGSGGPAAGIGRWGGGGDRGGALDALPAPPGGSPALAGLPGPAGSRLPVVATGFGRWSSGVGSSGTGHVVSWKGGSAMEPASPLIEGSTAPVAAELVDWIVEQVERRVLAELERRGRRHAPGVF